MECGACTACCTLLPIATIDKPVNTACPHCDAGCKIYNSKPQTCTEFICAYLQGNNVPEGLRPDSCGIIFIKHADRIFTGVLIPGAEVSDIAKGQIESFNDQGYSVILLSLAIDCKPHLMLASGHKANIIMAEYKEAISGNV